MKKSYSDSALNKLLRETRLIKANNKCEFCGKGNYEIEPLQTHHIIRRRHLITRWLLENVLCLCHKCHQFAHTKAGEIRIREYIGEKLYEWLCKTEKIIAVQFFTEHGITRNEYTIECYNKLKAEKEKL